MGRHKKKEIKVILYREQENNKNAASFNRNEAIEKMIGGAFSYVRIQPGCCINAQNSLMRKCLSGFSSFRSILKVYSFSRDKTFHYILFLRSINPWIALFAWFISKISGVKMAIERNEYPAVYIQKTPRLKKWMYENLILSWHYRLFSLLFVMTDELEQFFKNHVSSTTFLQKLPMTVDVERFDLTFPIPERPYVFYAGSLSEKKDGVESLICAFSEIQNTFPDLELKIAGSAVNNAEEAKLHELVIQKSSENRIHFLGNVDRNLIPEYLSSAKILVLPRPDSRQARGGFPTKLGEYLASGKPVIVTRVGEIPQILTEEQVFFISPDQIVQELKDKIIYIMEHEEHALNVGLEGKKAAIEKFSLHANIKFLKHGIYAAFGMSGENGKA